MANTEQLESISKSWRYGGSNTFYYYGLERLGSGNTLDHTSLNGTVAFVTNSDKLGNIYSLSNSYYYEDYGVSNKYGFSLNGEYKDPNGIIHIRNRAYLPKYAMFLQLDDYTVSLKSIISQNRRTFANNNPYRFNDKTGNNAEEVRTTAQTNQNQTGYDIDYVKAQVAEEYNQNEGEPIMPSMDCATLTLGGTIAAQALNSLIWSGIAYLPWILAAIAIGIIAVICYEGYKAYVNSYELQQEYEATVPQVSVGSNAGTIDTPSNNYNKGLDDALKDLGNRLLGTAGAATFGILLNKILSNIKKYTQRNTFNKKESHHVVPKKAGYDEPRLVLTWAGINRTTSLRHLTVNIAEIYLNLHYTIHHAPVVRDLYLDMLYLTYRNYYNRLGITCDPMSKSDITNKTRIIRDFLETISNETHDIMRRYYV